MRTVCIQQIARDITEYRDSWKDIINLIDKAAAKKPDLIVLPESAYPAYFLGYDEEKCEESLKYIDRVINDLKNKAKNYGIYIAAGIVLKENNKKYNGGILINRQGEIIATTKKSNLWHFDHKWLESGDIADVVDTEFGKIGLMICADGRAPEIPRILAIRGAEIIIDLANLTSTGRDPKKLSNAQLDYMLATRAIENNVWLIMADKIGLEANTVLYAGGSCVINPEGEFINRATPDKEEILVTEIDLKDNSSLAVNRIAKDYSILAEKTEKLPIYKKMKKTVKIAESEMQISAVQFEYEKGNSANYFKLTKKFVQQLEIQDSKIIVLPELDKKIDLIKTTKKIKDILKNKKTIIILTGYKSEANNLFKEVKVFSKEKDYGYYQKVHISKEEDLKQGKVERGLVKTPYGDLGLMIDQEGLLPEVSRKLMLMGADLIIWNGDYHHSKEQTIIRSRAAENKIFIVKAGKKGSYITTPGGNIIAATLIDINQAISKLILPPYSLAKTVVPGTNVVLDRKPKLYKELVK
ncbi:MAG: carbon-nitrogen hydrolase family protein [Bacillota bacterium]